MNFRVFLALGNLEFFKFFRNSKSKVFHTFSSFHECVQLLGESSAVSIRSTVHNVGPLHLPELAPAEVGVYRWAVAMVDQQAMYQ